MTTEMNPTQAMGHCPKCGFLYCPDLTKVGICTADMGWCHDPTANGDADAGYLRVWYEAHREGYWEHRRRREECADEFMLALMSEVQRIQRARAAWFSREREVQAPLATPGGLR